MTAGETIRFNCELCQSLCGMVATVEGGRLVKVAADRTHPVSRGYSCSKGRGIAARQEHQRIAGPRVDGGDVSWEAFLDDLGARVEQLVDDAGVDAVGVYQATGGAIGGYQAAARFFQKLGTKQRYSVRTLDAGPVYRAAELVTGSAYCHPVWLPEEPPTLAVLVGLNPSVSGGYVSTGRSSWPARLRDFQKRGGELWVVDPQATSTAHRADRHLAPRPGTDVLLLAWLVRELLAEGFDEEELATACSANDVERLRAAVAPFSLELVSQRTTLAPEDLLDLLAAIRRHRKVAVLAGTGLGFQPTGVTAHWLAWAVMIVTGSLDREGGLKFLPLTSAALDGPALRSHAPEDGSHTPGPASRPDLDGLLGELPGATLADEIEAGNLRALFVFGGNPITAAPDPERTRAALAKLDVLVVCDTFEVELAQMATHVMACTWLTERASFIYSPVMLPRAYFSPAVVPPGDDRRHPWWVFAKLGRRLGIDLLDGLDPDSVDDETVVRHFGRTTDPGLAEAIFASGVDGTDLVTRLGWAHEKALPDGRWRVAPPVLVQRLATVLGEDDSGPRLVCGRISSKVNFTPYSQIDDGPPPVRISPDIAEAQGISSGDRIRVSNAHGAVEAVAEVDDKLAAQSVWISHGWRRQNVNNLVDPTPDRLTAQPIFTGFPVEVARVVGDAAE